MEKVKVNPLTAVFEAISAIWKNQEEVGDKEEDIINKLERLDPRVANAYKTANGNIKSIEKGIFNDGQLKKKFKHNSKVGKPEHKSIKEKQEKEIIIDNEERTI